MPQPVSATAAGCPVLAPDTTENPSASRQLAALTALVRTLARQAATEALDAGISASTSPNPAQRNTP